MSYQLQFYFLWLPKLRQDFPKECTALKLYFWTKFYATVFVWEIILSDCFKAQNSVSSGTFLLLFFFTAQWQSPSVFSLSLLHWFLSPYLLEENHRQTMLMVYQIWSCEAICPSIPKFHLAKPTQFLPLLSAPIPSKKKKTNTTSWQDEHKSVSMSVASNLRPNLFFTSFFERLKTDFEENITAGLCLFFFPFKYGRRTCGRHVVPV